MTMNETMKIWTLTKEIITSYKDKNKSKRTEEQSIELEDRQVKTI